MPNTPKGRRLSPFAKYIKANYHKVQPAIKRQFPRLVGNKLSPKIFKELGRKYQMEKKGGSPRSTTPRRKSRSPRRKSRSPKRRSPKRKSPRSKSKSPKRRSPRRRSPRRKSPKMSPQRPQGRGGSCKTYGTRYAKPFVAVKSNLGTKFCRKPSK